MDLPQADPDKVKNEIEEIIGIDAQDALPVSAKSGMGIPDLIEQLIQKIPAPQGDLKSKKFGSTSPKIFFNIIKLPLSQKNLPFKLISII